MLIINVFKCGNFFQEMFYPFYTCYFYFVTSLIYPHRFCNSQFEKHCSKENSYYEYKNKIKMLEVQISSTIFYLGETIILFAPRAQPPIQILPPNLRVFIAEPAVYSYRPSCSAKYKYIQFKY